MMRNEQTQRNSDGARNRNNGRNQNQKSTMSQSKAILKNKRVKRNEHTIKASFRDSEGNVIKELIYTFCDGDLAELLLEMEKQLLKFGDCYDLLDAGWWKVLCQIGGRALEGRCENTGMTLLKEFTITMLASLMLNARNLKS